MTTYTTVQGDTWDGIAFSVYGQAELMTLLLAVNPSHTQTVVFSAGVALSVPDKPADASQTLPPWRRGE